MKIILLPLLFCVAGIYANEVMYTPQLTKEIHNSKFSNLADTYENVVMDYVYIQFNHDFNTWPEGEKVVNLVGTLLGLQPGELKEIRINRAEVTFKVSRNSKGYNSTDILKKIDDIRGELLRQLNIEVTRAGIADKVKV